jgi:hypothetical protein
MKTILKFGVFLAIAGFIGYSLGFSVTTNGNSMQPTITRDTWTFTNLLDRNSSVWDIVDFRCPEKCAHRNGEIQPNIVHRVTAISPEGCYWILGDNQADSWDSNDYGWLCPDKDIRIMGTVYPINF